MTDDDPEWSVSLSPSKKLDPLELETSQISRRLSSNGGGGSGSHEFGCPEEDCEWVCNRRQRLEKHLANKHGFSQEGSLCKTDEVVAAVQKARTDRQVMVRQKQVWPLTRCILVCFFVKKKTNQGCNFTLSILSATTSSQFRTLEGLF